MCVEPMTAAHAATLAIYQGGIDEGNATFETCAPGWPTFTAARLPGHRFVATRRDRSPAGWPPRPYPAAASTPESSSTRSTWTAPPAAGASGTCRSAP
ncbi:MAG: hypothetical protein ACLP8X_21850 [Streptosporangiaceae bacterium]